MGDAGVPGWSTVGAPGIHGSVGASGAVWDEAGLAEYLLDPTAYIDTHGGEGKSKMTFKLKKGGEDVAAYLASVAQ